MGTGQEKRNIWLKGLRSLLIDSGEKKFVKKFVNWYWENFTGRG